MSFLDKLERKLGWIALPHLSLYIVCAQVIGLFMILVNPDLKEAIEYGFPKTMEERHIRAISLVLIPFQIPTGFMGYVFAAFGWYIFHMMCTSLESIWGTFRLTLYVLIWILLTAVLGWLFPGLWRTSFTLYASVFFAFAYFFPNMEFLMFFVLPVKVKWLAWLIAGGILLFVFTGGLAGIIFGFGGFLNFLLFFSKELLNTVKNKKRLAEYKQTQAKDAAMPFHTCSVCSATDISRPDLDFRYRGEAAICTECIEKEKAEE